MMPHGGPAVHLCDKCQSETYCIFTVTNKYKPTINHI